MKIHSSIKHKFDLLSQKEKSYLKFFINQQMTKIVNDQFKENQFGVLTSQLLLSFREEEKSDEMYFYCEFQYLFNINNIKDYNLIILFELQFSNNVDFLLDKRAELKERFKNDNALFIGGHAL